MTTGNPVTRKALYSNGTLQDNRWIVKKHTKFVENLKHFCKI